ncbi:MAG: hypothetical protein QXG97_01280 [Nitrososphaerota archaeon]
MKEDVVFLVSDKIEGVEVGIDLWWTGKEFVRPYHLGNKVKNRGCFGKWVYDSSWDEVLGRFENLLKAKAKAFRGEISFEAIFNEEGFHALDVTPRLVRPAGSLMYYSLEDDYYPVIQSIAVGDSPEANVKAGYTAQVNMVHDYGWVKVCDVDDLREEIALTGRAMVVGGSVYIHTNETHGSSLVSCLGIGKSAEESAVRAYDVATRLAMYGEMNIVSGAWQKYTEEYLPRMSKFGYEW